MLQLYDLTNISGTNLIKYPVYLNPSSNDLEELSDFLKTTGRKSYENEVRITIVPKEKKLYIQPAQLFHNALFKKKLNLSYPDTTDQSVGLAGSLRNGIVYDLDFETFDNKTEEALVSLREKNYSFIKCFATSEVIKEIQKAIDRKKPKRRLLAIKEEILFKWKTKNL